MDLNRKNTHIILFIILTLVFIMNISTFKGGHNWENSDFVGYISQARSLVESAVDELAYHDNFMTANSTKDTGTLSGPWGFPILLSPVYYVFGADIYVMKVFTNLFFIFSLIVIFFLFQDRLTNFNNLLLIIILAFSTWFFDFKENVLSDLPFMFFSLFSLFLIKRFIIQRKLWGNKLLSFSLIGVLIFISYNIRAVGFILLPTLIFTQYLENRSSTTRSPMILDKFNYVPYLIFIFCSAAISLFVPAEEAVSPYLDKFSQLSLNRIVFDIKYYTVLPSRFFPFLYMKLHGYGFEYNKFSLVIYTAMLIFLFAGIIKNAKKDYLYIIYMLITIPVLMLFSSRQGFRLLIPIIPFFLYFLLKGLSTISISIELFRTTNPLKISMNYLFCAGLILISLVYISINSHKNILSNREGMIEGPYSNDSTGLFDYIKTNTDKNDAIIFHKPRSMYLFADRKSFALSKGKFKFDQLINSRAMYLACEKKENPYKLTPEDLQKSFNCPYENNTFILCALKNNTK